MRGEKRQSRRIGRRFIGVRSWRKPGRVTCDGLDRAASHIGALADRDFPAFTREMSAAARPLTPRADHDRVMQEAIHIALAQPACCQRRYFITKMFKLGFRPATPPDSHRPGET